MTKKYNFNPLLHKFWPSPDQIIKKYILRKERIQKKSIERKTLQDQAKENDKNRIRELAYKLWQLNGNNAEQNWKEAEELLRPLYWKFWKKAKKLLRTLYSKFISLVDLMRRYLKLSFKKTNKYVIISIAISILCLSALLVHLGYVQPKEDKQIKFDSIALILFFLFLIPWLSVFLEKAALPGILDLEFRKIKEQQNIQREEIEDIKFLLLNYITEFEKNHLRGLNSSNPFPYEFRESFEIELRQLLALRLIERHPGKGIRSANRDKRENNDLKEHFYITNEGKDYLARIERHGKDEEYPGSN